MKYIPMLRFTSGFHAEEPPINLLTMPSRTICSGGYGGSSGYEIYYARNEKMGLSRINIDRRSGKIRIKDFMQSPADTITATAGAMGDARGISMLVASNNMPIKKINRRLYIPLFMRDIQKASGSSGLICATFFAGCGGSSMGHRLAGFHVAYANEFWKPAILTYRANLELEPDSRSILNVSPEDVLTACNLKRGELDLMDGSPPCQTFSTAGKRNMRDKRTDLFDEWLRLLEGIMPRAFVAENVSGMIKGVAKGKFKEVLARMRQIGYQVECRLLDAQWLGVPQQRKRVIFIGIRSDLGESPSTCFPKPNTWRYSVADACPWIIKNQNIPIKLKRIAHGYFKGDARDIKEPASTITACFHGAPSIEGTAIGHEALKLKMGESSLASHGGRCAASPIHPTEQRKFTIAELKRLQSFPDDYDTSPAGGYAKQWAIIGNSVPPRMMLAISNGICEALQRATAKSMPLLKSLPIRRK